MTTKAHVMQTLHTNPTVVRFDFDYKKASEVSKKAHVMQTLAMFLSFYAIKLDSYPELSSPKNLQKLLTSDPAPSAPKPPKNRRKR